MRHKRRSAPLTGPGVLVALVGEIAKLRQPVPRAALTLSTTMQNKDRRDSCNGTSKQMR